MKTYILSLMLLAACSMAFTQEANYLTLENLPYYPESVGRADDYISERCVLDLYVPEQLEGFPTVILLDSEGKEFTRFFASKYPDIEKFLSHLKTSLENKDLD